MSDKLELGTKGKVAVYIISMLLCLAITPLILVWKLLWAPVNAHEAIMEIFKERLK